MIIGTCLLILIYTLSGRSIEPLLDKVRNVQWVKRFRHIGRRVKRYALKAGRLAARPVLQLYYVVRDQHTTTAEKALIYGCLVYVVMPHSLIPARVYKLLGLTDEAAALITVIQKVNSKITDDINAKVERTLDGWFGREEPATDSSTPAEG